MDSILWIPNLRDVYKARKVVSKYLPRTPLLYSKRLSRLLGFDVYLKLENTQPVRAFKVRGGVYYMYVNRDKAVEKGVITASTGNHAQSIAYAAQLFGAEATIVMPHGVSKVKIDALRALGAKLIFHGVIYEEAREYAEKLAVQKDMLYVHGVNEPLLYAGVGTMHLENIEDNPDVDAIINPIGGGSGASSAVIVAKSIDTEIKVIGVQAAGANSFYLSWRNKELTATGKADTIAEGLATSRAYELPYMILKDRIDDIVLVTDLEMKKAMKLLFEYAGQVAEPAGASALAAAIKIREELKDKNVIIMITGGNVDHALFREVLKIRV
jgi:threonine dehydratase